MLELEKLVSGLHEYLARAFEPVLQRLSALESREPIPGPKGDPGKDGRDGLNGKDGHDGVDGKDGEVGKPGERGEPGLNGKDGRDGVDGKSVTLEDVRPILEAELAKWQLDFERRSQETLQRAVDNIPAPKDGKDGRDGVDGMGFDDIDVSYDGERTFTISMIRGDRKKDFSFKTPHLIERGVWKQESKYERGDGVTFGGSFWIAQKDTEAKPGDNNSDWRLAVKRGRDGRDK